MENGRQYPLRLLAAAALTFGGLIAIALGVILAIAPADAPGCGSGARCISEPAVPPVADRARGSATD